MVLSDFRSFNRREAGVNSLAVNNFVSSDFEISFPAFLKTFFDSNLHRRGPARNFETSGLF